jgi:hypothetical protein
MGENGISISDKKQVKVDVFEDEDLISDEEKAAMAEDIEGDPDNDKVAAAKAQVAADKEAQEAADAKEKEDKIKLADEKLAKEKVEADKKATDEAAAAAAAAADDKAAKEAGKDGGEPGDGADKAVVVPQTAPPVSMQTMTVDE